MYVCNNIIADLLYEYSVFNPSQNNNYRKENDYALFKRLLHFHQSRLEIWR